MSRKYNYSDHITLLSNRVSKQDAARQDATAKEILQRFNDRPGIVLADEVGMGKTFVALAIATSIVLDNSKAGPVIVMVPPSLKDKWPRDWDVFKSKCLNTNARNLLKATPHSVESGVELLRLFDDKPLKYNLIFITHGALSRGLTDPWVKLSLIRRTFRRPSLDDIRDAFPRFASKVLLLQSCRGIDENLFERLLSNQPSAWRNIMVKSGLDVKDDPVPSFLIKAIHDLHDDNFDVLSKSLKKLPERKSKRDHERIKEAREEISVAFSKIWQEWITKAFRKISAPLLILDEAHHLKNPQTKLASLFHEPEAVEEAEMLGGALHGIFERMLFLTATPFQLGHRELFHVLERFSNISWKKFTAPSLSKERISKDLSDLQKALDMAQLSTLLLDRVWGRLRPEILYDDSGLALSPDEWMNKNGQTSTEDNPLAVELYQCYQDTKETLQNAETLLKPWVVRHTKPTKLPGSETDRRRVLPGASIKDDLQQGGLEVEGDALLPFLLAARTAAICARKTGRALFAEGLASSYEAYLDTRKGNAVIDEDNGYTNMEATKDRSLDWYLDNLDKSLKGVKARSNHPKVSATINKAIYLWSSGEKVLIFCHYRETGRALELYLKQRMRNDIARIAKKHYGIAKSEAWRKLTNIQKRFANRDDRLRQEADRELTAISQAYGFKADESNKIVDIMRRYLSTPSFLARHFTSQSIKKGALKEALLRKDGSGLTVKKQLEQFCSFLSERCVDEERLEYIDALGHIRKGSNVRLANGETPHETRRRLLLAFNTPFCPEILVASSVLSEGVDLHLNCRYIIHHDLCWNPSTLEQRTGRIDRIGAKAEVTKKPIHVYLPYISATQDEKIYRVVRDRERWFQVIMGEQYSIDEYSTDKLAIRVPFPAKMAEELALRLGVFNQASEFSKEKT